MDIEFHMEKLLEATVMEAKVNASTSLLDHFLTMTTKLILPHNMGKTVFFQNYNTFVPCILR